MTNLLRAIQCVVKNPISDLLDQYKSRNIVNDIDVPLNDGDAPLEELIKDIFANTLAESDESSRVIKHSQTFSYLGNQNNPPDFIIRDGDAVEVKKIKSFKAGIHLNSAYPKTRLAADDPMILASCRSVDGGNWESKDLIYIIGVVKENKLKRIWLIVGDCIAAEPQIYDGIKDKIIVGMQEIFDIEFSKNREINIDNNLDSLNINYSRITGKWGLASPVNIYDYLNIDYNEDANLQVIAIMKTEKYLSFPQLDLDEITKMALEIDSLEVRDVQIVSPNNPDNLIDSKLIIYQN
jgi:NgoPII restriction endonuclease